MVDVTAFFSEPPKKVPIATTLLSATYVSTSTMITTTPRLILTLILLLVSRTTSADAANPLKRLLNGPMSKSSEETNSGSNTCDNALAKSLVLANDEKDIMEKERDEARTNHAETLDIVSQLSSELESTKDSLSKRIQDLEHIEALLREAAVLQRAASEKELETAVREAEEKQQSMQTSFDFKLDELHKSWTTKVEEREANHADQVAALKAESEASVGRIKKEMEEKILALQSSMVTLEKEHEQQLAAVRQEAEASVQDVEQRLTTMYDDKHAELEKIKRQAEEERRAILKFKEQDAKRLVEEHLSQRHSMELQHSQIVADLKEKIENNEKKAIERLKVREKELKSRMDTMQHEAKKQLQDVQASHANELENLVKTIETMEADHSRLGRKMSSLQRKYEAAAKVSVNVVTNSFCTQRTDQQPQEIEEWRELHSARSYCNFTHITEDTTAAVATAGKIASAQLTAAAAVASEHVLVATKTASEQIKVASKVVAHAAEPHIETGRQMYDAHLKEHVDKHLLPIHEAHVKPALKVANKNIAVARKEASSQMQSFYRRTISEFKAACPAFKKQLREMQVHPSMQAFLREKCKDPKGTVDRFLAAIAILFVLVFRRFLWRTSRFLIYLPFQIMWYVSPLPLFFPSRKTVVPDIPDVVASSTSAADVTSSNGPANLDGFKKEKVGPAQ